MAIINHQKSKYFIPNIATMSISDIRQNYHAESEAAINNQINIELNASYVYQVN